MKKNCELGHFFEKCVAKKVAPPLARHEKVAPPPVQGLKKIPSKNLRPPGRKFCRFPYFDW